MGTTSAAATKRFQSKRNRQELSVAVRRRMKPKEPPPLPAQAEPLRHALARRRITLIGFVSNPVSPSSRHAETWMLTAVDPKKTDVFERFDRCLSRCGFVNVSFGSNPLVAQDGVAIICIVAVKPTTTAPPCPIAKEFKRWGR